MAAALATLLVGSAPRWAQAAVAVATVGAILTTLRSRRTFERRPLLLLLLAGMATWTLIQWLPLPAGLVAAVTPVTEGLRQDGAEAAGLALRSRLSADPAGSLRGVIFLLTLAGAAFVGLRVGISERGRYFLCVGVALTAIAAALITGVHELLGVDQLYGLYEPRQRPVILGPLLNTNHLGCLGGVGALTCLGLFVYRKQSSLVRGGWAFGSLACAILTFASLSRGAVIGLAAGLLVTLGTVFAQRVQGQRRSRRRRDELFSSTVPIAVMILCGLVTAVNLGAGTVMQQIENTSLHELDATTSKYAAWRSSTALVVDAPWTGVGRGGFETAFTRVHAASGFATFSHPENEFVQAVTEWGVPMTLVFGLMAAWMLIRGLRRWNDGPLAAGALGGISVVLFQSNFDFGIELLGLALPVTLLASTVTYAPLREVAPTRRPGVLAYRLAFACTLLAGAALLLADLTRSPGEDHQRLIGRPSRATIEGAITRHPLDYLPYGALAERLARENHPRAVLVLNHALRLHPTHPGLHRLAGRLLVRMRFGVQARAEYALAIRYSQDPRSVTEEVLARFSADEVAAMISPDLNTQRTFQLLEMLGRVDIGMMWLRRIVETTHNLRAADLLYSVAMREKNYAMAEAAARDRCRQLPSPACELDLARVLGLLEQPGKIVDQLADVEQWTGRVDHKVAGWLMRCDAMIALARRDEAKECLRRLDTSGLVSPGNRDIQRRQAALADDAR